MSRNNQKSIPLDADPTIFENNLKFVKDELADEFEQMFGPSGGSPANQPDCKIVTPDPGLCIKCFKVNTNEKFFINLCITDGIPAPEDIDEDALTKILQSEQPSSYRIPMSISQPRLTKDKSNNNVDVVDIAINPKFLIKCENQLLFRDFLIALILEALDDKYNIQVKNDNWLILKNRKFIGTLVTHRVQNRDVKTVYESYKNISPEQKKIIQELDKKSGTKQLIQEINETEMKKFKPNNNNNLSLNDQKIKDIKESISIANSIIPEYKLFSIKNNKGEVKEILAEFFLPDCISSNEIVLDIGEDRICLESMKRGYLFDKFLNFKIDQEQIEAIFNRKNKMLQIKMCAI